MGGINPYIEQVEADLPKDKYRIVFVVREGGEEAAVCAEVCWCW